MSVKKIISGMQTGSDMGGILAAKRLGLETGGMMPKGFKAEDGSHPEFAELYGAIEHSYSSQYPPRTEANAKDSDGTVIFGDTKSPGSKQTVLICLRGRIPYYVIELEQGDIEELPDVASFQKWLFMEGIKTLNVAGNRESKMPGIQDYVMRF